MRRYIENGECPFCGGRYKNMAGHTNNTHGIDKNQLKDMAGIPKTRSVCSPELATELADINRKRIADNPDRLKTLRPKGNRRVYSPGGRAVQQAKAIKSGKKQTAAASKHDAEILQRVQAGDLLVEVARTLGMSRSAAHRSLRRSGYTEDLRHSNSGYGRR